MFDTGDARPPTAQGDSPPDLGSGNTATSDPGPEDTAAPDFGSWDGPPGPELAALDLDQTSDYDLVEVARAARRLSSWAQAIELGACAELGFRPGQVPEFAADEIAAGLTLTRRAANTQLELAWTLSERLPATAAVLRAGRVDAPKARVLAEATATLDADTAQAVETAALDRAPVQTTGQYRPHRPAPPRRSHLPPQP